MIQDFVQKHFDYREDGVLLWKTKPCKRINIGDVAGYNHHTGYRYIEVSGSVIAAHRAIFLYHHGYLPKYVDHIDRDRMNNRIDNLREITNSHNRVNSHTTWAKNGYRGVKQTRNGSFEARISKAGKYYHLGTYPTPEEASYSYEAARSELYPGICN